MKRFTGILIVMGFALLSCRNSKIAGTYRRDSQTFILNRDYTFQYTYQFDLLLARSSGRWSRVGKNEIVLNSKLQFTNMPLNVKEYKTGDSSSRISVNFNLKNANSKSVFWCYIKCNNGKYHFTQSLDSLKAIHIKEPLTDIQFFLQEDNHKYSMRISSNSLQTAIYSPQFKTGVKLDCNIEADARYFYYQPFINNKYKFDKKGIYDHILADDTWWLFPRMSK